MLKKLLITTAVSGLMLSAALAQSSMSPSGSNPNASQSGSSSSDAMKSGASGSSGSSSASSSASGSSSGMFVSTQKPDELLASKFKGTDVLGSDNQKIGDVSDILFTKEGKIDAYVISVGGFLGVGAKEVAIAPSAAQLIADDKDRNSFKLKVNLNKDQLAQAPGFEEHRAQRTTTGAGSGSQSNTGSSGMAPRNAPNAPGAGSVSGGSSGGASGTGGATR